MQQARLCLLFLLFALAVADVCTYVGTADQLAVWKPHVPTWNDTVLFRGASAELSSEDSIVWQALRIESSDLRITSSTLKVGNLSVDATSVLITSGSSIFVSDDVTVNGRLQQQSTMISTGTFNNYGTSTLSHRSTFRVNGTFENHLGATLTFSAANSTDRTPAQFQVDADIINNGLLYFTKGYINLIGTEDHRIVNGGTSSSIRLSGNLNTDLGLGCTRGASFLYSGGVSALVSHFDFRRCTITDEGGVYTGGLTLVAAAAAEGESYFMDITYSRTTSSETSLSVTNQTLNLRDAQAESLYAEGCRLVLSGTVTVSKIYGTDNVFVGPANLIATFPANDAGSNPSVTFINDIVLSGSATFSTLTISEGSTLTVDVRLLFFHKENTLTVSELNGGGAVSAYVIAVQTKNRVTWTIGGLTVNTIQLYDRSRIDFTTHQPVDISYVYTEVETASDWKLYQGEGSILISGKNLTKSTTVLLFGAAEQCVDGYPRSNSTTVEMSMDRPTVHYSPVSVTETYRGISILKLSGNSTIYENVTEISVVTQPTCYTVVQWKFNIDNGTDQFITAVDQEYYSSQFVQVVDFSIWTGCRNSNVFISAVMSPLGSNETLDTTTPPTVYVTFSSHLMTSDWFSHMVPAYRYQSVPLPDHLTEYAESVPGGVQFRWDDSLLEQVRTCGNLPSYLSIDGQRVGLSEKQYLAPTLACRSQTVSIQAVWVVDGSAYASYPATISDKMWIPVPDQVGPPQITFIAPYYRDDATTVRFQFPKVNCHCSEATGEVRLYSSIFYSYSYSSQVTTQQGYESVQVSVDNFSLEYQSVCAVGYSYKKSQSDHTNTTIVHVPSSSSIDSPSTTTDGDARGPKTHHGVEWYVIVLPIIGIAVPAIAIIGFVLYRKRKTANTYERLATDRRSIDISN
ncbi:hypothetical protein PROFUN_09155 [Planoprotostelium fungivorum]|uniref:Uncharacterized protein n=1 Tax=Planoprotostelium fungivorum TaxID=1890364 RepID=A0A2P6MVJ1_9EUKA|nr:hypothetical protein PROFUN_09155 [Planoprotostelium fungivorum]